MSSQLFLDGALRFDGEEKLAGTLTRMGDNVDNWPQEITQEAYKQLPYLSDFETNIVLDKVDEQKGFAYGSIEVRPKTAMTMEEQQTSEMDKVHIPIVVKDNMMSPLDVFMSGKKFQHLTEGRLRSALFRPEMMDSARTRPYDPSMVHDLQPPIRAGYGGFGSGGVKMGSAELMNIPLLPQLYNRVKQAHIDRVKEACTDPTLRSVITNGDEGVLAAFNSAMGLTVGDPVKTAHVIRDSIPPRVVQFQKLANGNVMVKWANPDMYAPESEVMAPSAASELAGEEDIVAMLEGDGTITASPDAPVKETMEAGEVKVVDSFGLWKVQDAQGNDMVGWVFPSLLSMQMQPLPLSLFTNGSQHSVQEHIAGEMAGKSTDLPKGQPKGYGCLYFIDHGTAKAFVPMNVTTTMRSPDGLIQYMATDDLGEQCNFSFSPDLKTVVQVEENQYMVPAHVCWMPLRGKTELVSEPMAFHKTAAAALTGVGQKAGKAFGELMATKQRSRGALRNIMSSFKKKKKGVTMPFMPKAASRTSAAELVGDKDVFTWRGPAVAKLGSDQTKFIKRAEAEFLGVAMGLDPSFCKEALDRASKGKLMSFIDLRAIKPLHEKMAAAKVVVMKELDKLDPPIHNYNLIKEAAVLDDALTADKILGLGFINAENISTFVDMLPQLESTASKLAEMLLASRLGLKDIPEVALERMLSAIEDVIRGLRSLQQKEEMGMQ